MTFKQNSLQRACSLWSKSGLLLVVCFSCIGSRGVPAQAAAPDGQSGLSLLAAPGLENGTYGAAFDITMPPGSHTYWKMPGDAGVPPVFSFAGSRNVASARVLYPAPRRMTEAGLETFGYLGHVVFPVVVTPADAAKPAELKADVAYAVCDKICRPAHATATVALTPDGGKTGDAPIVAAAFATVPAPATPRERADLSLARDPGAKPTWTLTWHGTMPLDDIFADAPEGFYFATRRSGPSTWTLVAEETVAARAAEPVAVALTLTRPAHPLVIDETLDLRSATR